MVGIGNSKTDRIVNNFLRWFITEPRKKRKGESEDSKRAYYSIINDLRLWIKKVLERKSAENH